MESVDESFEYAMHEVMLSKKEEKNSFLCTKQKKEKSQYYGTITCK